MGRANLATPFLPVAQRYTDLRQVFRVSQAYSDMIWTRRTKEYLPQWNVRNKWNKGDVRQLKVNNLERRKLIWNMLVEKQELKL